jgi:hypothetical protein
MIVKLFAGLEQTPSFAIINNVPHAFGVEAVFSVDTPATIGVKRTPCVARDG